MKVTVLFLFDYLIFNQFFLKKILIIYNSLDASSYGNNKKKNLKPVVPHSPTHSYA